MLRKLIKTFVPQKEKASVIPDKQSEEKLQLSELRYRRLFESAQVGTLILDADSGNIVDANPFLEKLLGYSQLELSEKKLWEIGVFKDTLDSKTAFRQLKIRGYIRYENLPLQTKDGRIINVEFISNTYEVGSQKIIQCNIRDISDRIKIEILAKTRSEELKRVSSSQEDTKQAMLNVMEDLEQAKSLIEIEKAKDEAIIASIGDGLIAVGNDKKINMVNKATENILGWKTDELIGKIITALPLEDANGDLIPLNKRPTTIALAEDKPLNLKYYFEKKDKTKFPIAITATPIKHNGRTTGLIEIIRDITRETEIDKSKSEFVSIASHQLRTPLGIIKWYIEALENEDYLKKAPLTIRKYVAEIYKSNERVLSLVRELLSVSRIDQERVKNAPKLINIMNELMEIVVQMQIIAHKKKIKLLLTIQDQKIQPVYIDDLRLHEIIENLISNALEYSLPQGSVNVTLDKVDENLLISVKDSGIGISAADQKKLFTRFFRSEKAISQNPEGSGLGLYVVKSYVEGWGGKISITSAEGKGSTFVITLPISQKKDTKGGDKNEKNTSS